MLSFLIILSTCLILEKNASANMTSLDFDPRKNKEDQSEPIVNILNPDVLNLLESTEFSLSELLGAQLNGSQTSDLFASNSYYKSFAETLGKSIEHSKGTDQLPEIVPKDGGDIPEMVRLIRGFEDKGKRSENDSKGGYFIKHLSNNSQYPYTIEYDGDEPRHFDYRWLNSKYSYFKLAAVVNRMDRVDFNMDSCGEIRFIYRLSYKSGKSSSSLPFFINVVQSYPKKKSCSEYAKSWILTSDTLARLKKSPDPIAAYAQLLKNGPLKNLKFEQLESNFQSLRFTSGYMQDFGGQAMYQLRIFKKQKNMLVPIALENTPDVLAIEKNPSLLTKFVDYLRSGNNLEKLDQGTLVVDFNEHFLTKLAVSWSTLGRARSANKPYSRLFQDKKKLLESIDISKLKFIKSYDGLVERLNNMTCMGCHQSGGTAGFHMLGYADKSFSHGFNRQELPFSAHAYAEMSRRKSYTLALASDKKPNQFRPHSNFSAARWTPDSSIPEFEKLTAGQMCLLNSKLFSKNPNCNESTICQKTVGSKNQTVIFGECIKEKMPLAGSACWTGDIAEKTDLPDDRGQIPSYNFFAFQDKWQLAGTLKSMPGYKCVLPQSGAPLGRSSRSCTNSEENFIGLSNLENRIPDEICGNQGGNGFDLCAATGDSGACLESRVVRSMLDTCYPGHFCREDYICQSIPQYNEISEEHYGTKKNGKRVNQSLPKKINADFISIAKKEHLGFCAPTYFLFNMRLDGHPSPITGLPPGDPKIDRSQPKRGYN